MQFEIGKNPNNPFYDSTMIIVTLRIPFSIDIKVYVKDDDFPTLINSTFSESNFRECLAADGRTRLMRS